MATTTTITTSKDNFLDEGRSTFNNGVSTTMQFGAKYKAGAYNKVTGVMEFDVSGFNNPSVIVSAIITFVYQVALSVSTVQSVTLARLNQDFNETGSSWDEAESGVSWTGGAGGFGNAETDEPTYTFSVGNGQGSNVSIDIKDLVIDAINRRSGVLRLIAAIDGTPTGAGNGYTNYATKEHATDTCSIEIIEADRIVWVGGTDTVLSTNSNWEGGAKPTNNDHALFVTNGAFAPNTGTITCSHCYFGKQFSSDVGSSASSIAIVADKVFVDTKAQLYLYILADEVRIRGAKRIVDGCVIRGTVANVYIMNCESEVRVEGNANFTNVFVMSGSKLNPAMGTTEGVVSQVILDDGLSGATVLCEGGFNIEDNGESVDVSLFGGGKYVLNNTSEVDGVTNLTIASGSVCYFNGKEIQTDLTMYGGTFTLEDNKNSQLDMPTSITAHGSKINLQSGLDSANATAFSGTTFVGTNAQITLGKSVTITPSA